MSRICPKCGGDYADVRAHYRRIHFGDLRAALGYKDRRRRKSRRPVQKTSSWTPPVTRSEESPLSKAIRRQEYEAFRERMRRKGFAELPPFSD